MTNPCKLPGAAISGARAVPGTASARAAREQAAPALFRLLSESALYRSLFSACGVALGIVEARSPRPVFIQVNRAFERSFACQQSEACRNPVATLLLNGDIALERRLFGETAARAQIRATQRDGSAVPIDMTIDPLRDCDGRVTHWAVAFLAERAGTAQARPLREAFAATP